MKFGTWFTILKRFAPIVLAITPAAPLAPFIATAIQAAEQIPDASGPTKLAIAREIVKISVNATNAQLGYEKVDPALVDQAVEDGINTVVAVVNVKHAAEAATDAHLGGVGE